MMNRRSLSSADSSVLSRIVSRMTALPYGRAASALQGDTRSPDLTCRAMPSSSWKSVSRPRALMPCSSDVAMFMCASIVCFRAVSSGRAVMAALRCEALDDRSLSGGV